MPTRLVRDGIVSSEAVCSLSWAEEVLYRRLMSAADDYGRFPAAPKLIRSACYPLQIDKVSDSDIGKWLAQVAEAGLVRVYPASDGKRYIEIVKFGQQIRSKSKYPAPDYSLQASDNNCLQPKTDVHLGVFVSEGVSEGGAKPLRKRTHSPTKTPYPENFSVSDRVREWAKKRGFSRLDDHLDSFQRKCAAKGYEYVDWDSAFMEAIREDWAKLGTTPSQPGLHLIGGV